MKTLHFDALWTGLEWMAPAFVTIDKSGLIAELGTVPPKSSNREKVQQEPGWFLPGFHNGHSHAFQYRMAGMTEYRSAGAAQDDFWSWRELMYQLALNIDPDTIYSIAVVTYSQMVKSGYTAATEFHYLHRDPDGKPYDSPAELGSRLMDAADIAGIHLTLVPVYYNQGNFNHPPSAHQRRFICDNVDHYRRLLDHTDQYRKQHHANVILGHGIHSLRAANRNDVIEILTQDLTPGPIHLHIAEQTREVDDCLAAWGQRPVEWLMNHVPMTSRINLVHATHLSESECLRLAQSEANVVICPSTEGNLGDGIFPFAEFVKARGNWTIGTDSHIGMLPFEELRWLDYQQRLLSRQRNVIAKPGEESGEHLLSAAMQGGYRATGFPVTSYPLRVGQPLDGYVVDMDHPLFWGKPQNKVIPSLIFSGGTDVIKGVMTRGQWRVRDGVHTNHEAIAREKKKFITALP